MDLRTFLSPLTAPERDEFAKQCGSTRGVLQNIMYGIRPCGPELAVAVERESKGRVRRWDLRPDDWYRIWPELIDTDGAPAIPQSANDNQAARA
jgi:DNA-binding transcriptional regulator YdaS (Cro superfamily)